MEDLPPDGGMDLLGLYEGTALTERGWDYAGVLPDRITIYRLPTLQVCETETDVVDEVAITVVHEIAHHFGIDEGTFAKLAEGAKENCPISRLLSPGAEITLSAKLA